MTASPLPVPVTRPAAIAALTGPGSVHALETIEVGGRRVRNFVNAPPSLRALFEATASDLPFLVYGDERSTYAQAWRAASRIGHRLVHDDGVAPGDRVAIAMRNYPEWILAFTAATSIGAVAVAMNAHWQTDEMRHALLNSGAKVLIADQERLDRLAQASPVPGLRVYGVRAQRLPRDSTDLAAAMASVGEVAMPTVAIAPDDLATMLYTSGSSGRAKGVPSSHRNILAALLSWELDLRIGALVAGIDAPEPAEQAGTLLAVPLFHVTGLHASYLSSYRLQRRLALMYRWDAEEAARLIDGERLTSVVAPAAITGDLVRVAQAGGHDLSSLSVVGGGGAPRAPEQVRQIRASFTNAMPNIGWGMTETNAIGAGNGGEDYLARPASSGRCSQVLDFRITDESGRDVPPGDRGELWVRGTSVFAGYWKLPQATAEAFVGDWFRTGDGAYIDDEGFLFIVDRLKDLIIRGGENIACAHVEAALLMHPQVHEAAVYAVPDERLGEEVGATIHADAALDLAALRDFLAAHLARYELPRTILRSPGPLPRTPSGKIYKREIRKAALEGVTLASADPMMPSADARSRHGAAR